jgi:hypothetical protein
MTQFVPEFLDYRVHLVFDVQFLFLEGDFLKVVVGIHVGTALQFLEFDFVLPVFLDQTAELRISGHQVFFDLLLLHHHHRSSLNVGWQRKDEFYQT